MLAAPISPVGAFFLFPLPASPTPSFFIIFFTRSSSLASHLSLLSFVRLSAAVAAFFEE
jgi:hypothetical protein